MNVMGLVPRKTPPQCCYHCVRGFYMDGDGMAGDWMAIRLDLHEDPAVISISSALGIDADVVVGKLCKLWSWANKQLADGVAKGVTTDWVDRYVSATGFAAAMAKAEWLQVRSGGIHFPNFDVWNSKSAKRRLLKTKQKQGERGEVGQFVANVSSSNDDKKATREEKRREEKEEGVPPGEPPKTRKQMAASLATEYRFRIPGVRKQMLEELTPLFEEKLRVYGESRYAFILEKIKGDRDKSLPLFRFWQLCGMDIPQPTQADDYISPEQRKFDADLAKIAAAKAGKHAS